LASLNPSTRTKLRTQAKRENNLVEHATTPPQAHQQLNSQHHNHPQFKKSEHEASIMLAPRAYFDGVRTLGQARLRPIYMGLIQAAIDKSTTNTTTDTGIRSQTSPLARSELGTSEEVGLGLGLI
jgi:hypothetical protein